ncbi:hypothetical protein M0804_008993 [Polistes exclamans]|nr:hypothetical protein M0804_008993 [Polistes exclamans]
MVVALERAKTQYLNRIINQDNRYRVMHARIPRTGCKKKDKGSSCGTSAGPLSAEGLGRLWKRAERGLADLE